MTAAAEPLSAHLSPEEARRPGIVRRTRLLDLLDDHADARVVAVTGPAGSGKSTLAHQYRASQPRRSVSLSLHTYHDEPAALAELIVTALNRIDPGQPGFPTRVVSTEPTFSSVVVPALVARIQACSRSFLLVLDDIHLIEDAGCKDLLRAVAAAIPVGSQIMILGRVTTPQWLSRMRAAGQLFEVGAAELALDFDEGRQAMDDLGLELSSEEVRSLIVHSEGWAVGVHLTALAIRAGHDQERQPLAMAGMGSERVIVDYLREEVLVGLTPSTLEFLIRTSVLDELNGPLCDAVLQRTGSGAELQRLHERTLLVLALDGRDADYRYHHLLRDALLAELDRTDPEIRSELLARASAWYERAGDTDAAIRFAAASGQLELIERLIWTQLPLALAIGEVDRLGRWLKSVPESVMALSAELSLAAAWHSMEANAPSNMNRWILTTERLLGPSWRDRLDGSEVGGCFAVLLAVVGRGGLAQMVQRAQQAGRALVPDSPWLSTALLLQGTGLLLLNRPDEGIQKLWDAERVSRAIGIHISHADTLCQLGLVELERGNSAKAKDLVTEALDELRTHRLDRASTAGHCTSAMALMLAVQGDRSRAQEMLALARRRSAEMIEIAPWFAVQGPIVQARTAILLGDASTAQLLLTEARQFLTEDLADSPLAAMLAKAEAALADLASTATGRAALTPAELRVLQFLPGHLTLQQISAHLFLSRHTIKSQCASIYRKLGVRSRTEAVSRAGELGLVPTAALP